MNSGYLRSIYLRLAGVVTLVVMVALAATAFLSHRTFESALVPQMAAKVVSEAASVRALVVKAVESGVPFHELYGVEARFAEVKKEMPEVGYIALTDTRGLVLHESRKTPDGAAAYFASPAFSLLLSRPVVPADPLPVQRVGTLFVVSVPIVAGEGPLGMLHMGMDARFVDDMVLDMMYDVLVVLVVALFFTFELLHFIAGARLDAALLALSRTFERGAAGDFVIRAREKGEQAFQGLLQVLDAVLARLNASYAALAAELDQSRRVPAHERHPGISQAQGAAATLHERFQFGRAEVEPSARDQSQLSKVRAPLFMFILAEELTRSFLPGYVKELLVPVPGLSQHVLIGLPIALFMLIVAIGQPFLGVWCERVGQRRAMRLGAWTAAAGFVASAFAVSVFDLLLWRSLCALGYALVFVSAQAYVLEHAASAERAKSFAVFVGAIMAATVCGPSIGGILADNVGVRPTFLLAALLASVSVAVIGHLPETRGPAAGAPATRLPTLREIGALLRNPRFMLVTGLAAMPAKVLLTGVCFYLMPLALVASGSTQTMAGRVLMAYAVVMVLMAPLTASLAATRERMHWLVGGGLVVSGLGCALEVAGTGVGWMFAAVTLVGVGQAMSISAQSALVAEHCGPEIEQLGEGVVYGVYRLLERIGNALGPMVAAGLAMRFDYGASFAVIGGGVAACGAFFVLAARREPRVALAAA